MEVEEFWDSRAQNKTSKISTKMQVQEFWDSVGRTTRRKSQKLHFQEFWDSCAQNKTSEISNVDFQEFWDSCADCVVPRHEIQGVTLANSLLQFALWVQCLGNSA